MYKTVWIINDENSKIKLTYYHFGKSPQFPPRYMQAELFYETEMLWNVPLVYTPKMFFKCLFHIIKRESVYSVI